MNKKEKNAYAYGIIVMSVIQFIFPLICGFIFLMFNSYKFAFFAMIVINAACLLAAITHFNRSTQKDE